MRRMADLQIEKEFGVIGTGGLIEMAVQEDAEALPVPQRSASLQDVGAADGSEREPTMLEQIYAEEQEAFEQRATTTLLPEDRPAELAALPGVTDEAALAVDVGVVLRLGDVIEGLGGDTPQCKTFHAGTALADGNVVTAGGRVLCVVGLGADIAAAQTVAYRGVAQINWRDHFYRSDIGHRALAR